MTTATTPPVEAAADLVPSFVRVTTASRRIGIPAPRLRALSNSGQLCRRYLFGGRDDYFRVDELLEALKRLPPGEPSAVMAQRSFARELADQAAGCSGLRGRTRRLRGSSERFA